MHGKTLLQRVHRLRLDDIRQWSRVFDGLLQSRFKYMVVALNTAPRVYAQTL